MIASTAATPAYRTRQRIEHERLIVHTGVTQVPLAVLRLPLSPSAFRLYVLFGSLIADGDTCQISRETLAETLPLSVRQISTLITELVNFRLLAAVPGYYGRASFYTLLPVQIAVSAEKFPLVPPSLEVRYLNVLDGPDLPESACKGEEQNKKNSKNITKEVPKERDVVTSFMPSLNLVEISRGLVGDLRQVAKTHWLTMRNFASPRVIRRFALWLEVGVPAARLLCLLEDFDAALALALDPSLRNLFAKYPTKSGENFLRWCGGLTW